LKIAVVNNCVPFIRGGAEFLAEWLTAKLNEYGHQTELIRLPFAWETPEQVIGSILAARLIRLSGAERVIGLKFPAYLVPHDNKIVWLLHQFRQVYDLWGTGFQSLSARQDGERLRSAVASADDTYLRQARRIYANSHVTANRLLRFNGIGSSILYPPLLETRGLECDAYEDFVFCPGRITDSKRQRLLVESMMYCRSGVRLVVAGKEEPPVDLSEIEEFIRTHGLQDKVTLIPRFITDQEKAAYYRRALACAYIPYDEDSYGYVTLEAFECRKPVLTCSDSGGIQILVKHGRTGFVAEPDPRAIAAGLDRLYEERAVAMQMGEAGYRLMRELRIDWDRVIESLTA